MSSKLTASDRRSLIRLASTMPVGSAERKAILKGLKKTMAASSRKTAGDHPLDRDAIVYFGIATEDYNIEEDADNGDEFAQSLMNDGGRGLHKLEGDALRNLSRMFKTRIMNEGHDGSGELVCKFPVDSWEDIKKIDAVLNRHHIGGDDEIDTGVQYVVARDFRLYPDGISGRVFYGETPGAEGTWDDWLSEHKDMGRRASDKTAKHPLDGIRGHQLLPRSLARKIPALYSQENEDDPIAWVKFFSPYTNATWYITEYDPSSGRAFGWADMGRGELGYISVRELEGLNRNGLPLVERDLYWKPRRLSKAKGS